VQHVGDVKRERMAPIISSFGTRRGVDAVDAFGDLAHVYHLDAGARAEGGITGRRESLPNIAKTLRGGSL